ncbi:MAG TPA: Trk system potassium transporter TrkA [Propylenella sp.]
MRVIICGAGQVGSTIARHLASEGIDVTVIDNSPLQARRVDESYDVRGIVGHASHPKTLEQAGAHDADMLIAVTRYDEVNMVACQIAYSLFNVRRRIARIRHHGYLEPLWKKLYAVDQLPIDVIISPEFEVATSIARRLKAPGAFDMTTLAEHRIQLLGIHCRSRDCPVVNRPLSDLPEIMPEQPVTVIAIIREGRAFVPTENDRIQPGDDVYVITDPLFVDGIMAAFGHSEQIARRIIIIGGGNVGLHLARLLGKSNLVSLKIIESQRERADFISQALGDSAVVLCGDALDADLLREARIAAAETVVAVTNDDETNIFASMLAKRVGCQRAIALVNKASYEPMLPALGIDAVINPSTITISTILRHVRHSPVTTLYTLREDFGDVIETTAQEGSRLVRGKLREVRLPQGMLVAAILRDGELIIPNPDSQVQPGDRIIAVIAHKALRKAEAILAGTAARTA